MGNLKELQKLLLNSVAEKVAAYDFKKANGPNFIRRAPPGRFALHLTFINHHEDFDVTADVAIRFDELENLLNEHKPYLSASEKKDTYSLGAELGNIVEDRPRRWSVADAADVKAAADSIVEAFAKVGLPYMEQYSDPEKALAVFSGDDKESWLHSPFDDERAMRAIAMAFLMNRVEKFYEIAVAKTNYLASKNNHGLQSFLKLRATLERGLTAVEAICQSSNCPS